MPTLEKSLDVQVEECLKVQIYVPPLVYQGRKLKFSFHDIQGAMGPIHFLIQDGEDIIKAKFHINSMTWEIVEEEDDGQER